MLTAIFWSALATGTILIGMALAYRNLVSPRWTGLIMAFGAGAIISAATYQLVLGAVAEEQRWATGRDSSFRAQPAPSPTRSPPAHST